MLHVVVEACLAVLIHTVIFRTMVREISHVQVRSGLQEDPAPEDPQE